MSRDLGPQLPEGIRAYLRERCALTGGAAVTLLTVDAMGCPHVCLVGGVAPKGPERVLFGLPGQSGTSGNLRRHPQATLLLADRDLLVYVKGHIRDEGPRDDLFPGCNVFTLTVERVLADDSPGVRMVSGIQYEFVGPEDEMTQDERRMLQQLMAE